MKILKRDDREILLILRNKIDLESFSRRIKVKDKSFSENILARLFIALTSELVDLRREYQIYYRREYNSFAEFLYKQLLLERPLIEEILKALRQGNSVFYRKMYSTGDYNLEQFLYENKEIIDEIGKLVEGKDEN